jgi:hypothetical protein
MAIVKRTVWLCLLVLLVGRPVTAGDPGSDAKRLSDSGAWISEDSFLVVVSKMGPDGKKEQKCNIRLKFAVAKGQASGKVSLAMTYPTEKGMTGEYLGDYQFELIEKDGKRSIRLLPPAAALVVGKEPAARIVTYELDGDRLTILFPLLQWSASKDDTFSPLPLAIRFKREK